MMKKLKRERSASMIRVTVLAWQRGDGVLKD